MGTGAVPTNLAAIYGIPCGCVINVKDGKSIANSDVVLHYRVNRLRQETCMAVSQNHPITVVSPPTSNAQATNPPYASV